MPADARAIEEGADIAEACALPPDMSTARMPRDAVQARTAVFFAREAATVQGRRRVNERHARAVSVPPTLKTRTAAVNSDCVHIKQEQPQRVSITRSLNVQSPESSPETEAARRE
jgi:hypothetical protein